MLGAIPLFIFMGSILERAGIAERLFDALYMWTRRLPGGLAVAALLMCTIFAAASGVVGATETLVGMLAIPAMMKRSYDNALISGTICGGGSLGTIIPPSIPVVVLAPIAALPVGDLLAGILLPGLMMSGLFILYIVHRLRAEARPRARRRRSRTRAVLGEKIKLTAGGASCRRAFLIFTRARHPVPWAGHADGGRGLRLARRADPRDPLPADDAGRLLFQAALQTVSLTAMILAIVLAGACSPASSSLPAA